MAGIPALEVLQHLLGSIERGFHVHPHHFVNVLVGEPRRRTGESLPHIVDPHVDSTKADQRCFNEEQATTAAALLLDWYDFALTPRARMLAQQVLWDKGVSVIERDMMKWD